MIVFVTCLGWLTVTRIGRAYRSGDGTENRTAGAREDGHEAFES